VRLLVTRPQPQGEATARRLAARGYAPLLAPLLAIVPEEIALPGGGVDAIAVTSAAAVQATTAGPASEARVRLAGLPLFAVGEKTAAAARAAGFRDVRVGGGSAAALAEIIAAMLPAGARVLHLAGRDRAVELAPLLADAGIHVDVQVVYRAEAEAELPAEVATALASGGIGGALVYSARSAEALCAALRRAGLAETLSALPFYALSPAVAAALQAAGAAHVAVARRPHEDDLLALLPPPDGNIRSANEP